MKLFVFLGNCGEEYCKTRHNVGFIICDYIMQQISTKIVSGNWRGDLYRFITSAGEDVLILKPNTFMNLSGNSVILVKNFYKIELRDIIVFYDDIDLEIGKIKIKNGGGSGGHNGIKSIDNSIGKDYFRVRVGIGRPNHPSIDIADYVLTKFTQMQFNEVIVVGGRIASLLMRFITDLENVDSRSKLIESLNKR